ncbi:hypothetical protein [Methanimicrococcus stummii]|uniref:hypothetical protein n=1 Tax=Methanimicrococcus stummii TaxID=3028294 RepID=UPI00292F328E|nr:hypothetical protein [Methanimicrococcus sp. Es2]
MNHRLSRSFLFSLFFENLCGSRAAAAAAVGCALPTVNRKLRVAAANTNLTPIGNKHLLAAVPRSRSERIP